MSFDKKQFEQLFNPKAIALIGASSKADKVGYALLKNILDTGYTGEVYPINTHAKHILGIKTYPNINEVKHSVDLAIIAIGATSVPEVVEECQKIGIKTIIVISAGFKETGLASGKILEKQLTTFVLNHELLLVGPNCLGIINTIPSISLNATFARAIPAKGNIAFISQSGAIGIHALEFAEKHDIGFSKFVTIGNKSALSENELIDYFHNDPETKVILLYLESFSNGDIFRKVVKSNNSKNRKPIIVLKSGRTESGKQAAMSHTGALAGEDGMISYFLEDCGVIRVANMEEMFNTAMMMANQPKPKGNRLMVITNAGGQGIMAMDSAENHRLKIAQLSDEEQLQLRKILPPAASVKNPVDILGDAGAERYKDVLKNLIRSKTFDMILLICTPQFMTHRAAILAAIEVYITKARDCGVPVAAVFPAVKEELVVELFDDYDLPNYEFPEQAVQSLSYYMQYQQQLIREATYSSYKLPERKYLHIQKQIEQVKADGSHYLNEVQSYKLLKEYGLKIVPYQVVTNLKQTLLKAEKLEYPLVAKIVAKGVIHKYDIGGVIVGINNKSQLIEAFKKLSNCVSTDRFQGVVLQNMMADGIELIMGVKHHEGFGHAIMFGLGGTYVEILEDVTFGMVPLSEQKALQMINSIKGVKLLNGYRSKAPVNKHALVQMLIKLSDIVGNFPEITSLDLNPVFAVKGKVVVADARVFIKK